MILLTIFFKPTETFSCKMRQILSMTTCTLAIYIASLMIMLFRVLTIKKSVEIKAETKVIRTMMMYIVIVVAVRVVVIRV